ncbi:hypothetical protein D3C72_1853490 [compost metagenome]
MPVPPATRRVLGLLEVAGKHRAALGDALVGVFAAFLETLATPLAPAVDDGFAFPFEAVLPVAKEAAGDDRGVMGPVLEQLAVVFQQRCQMFAAIGLVARKQDLVVGALHRRDAVDLHEADVVDQLQQTLLAERAVRCAGKALLCEEDAPGIAIGEPNRHDGKNRLLFPYFKWEA